MFNFAKSFALVTASVVLVPLAAADSSTDRMQAVDACAALSQSLENYRKAIATQTGISEAAQSSLYDDSDGMAVVRAKAGCPSA
jgi:hypothetical protein